MVPCNTFYINFNTQIHPGKIEAVKITIELETIEDMDKPLRLDLVDHPLFPDLLEYIKANGR